MISIESRETNCYDEDECKYFGVVSQGSCQQHCIITEKTKFNVKVKNSAPTPYIVQPRLRSRKGHTLVSPEPHEPHEWTQLGPRETREFVFEVTPKDGLNDIYETLKAEVRYLHDFEYTGKRYYHQILDIRVEPSVKIRSGG